MKPKILLKIAAIIMLLHALGHTVGVATWKTKGDVPTQVIQTMQESEFNFMGKESSTMAGFYTGFGYCGTILLLFIASLLWTVSCWKDRSTAIPILWLTACSILSLAVVEIIYFFPMAVAFCVISVILVFLSIWKFNKTSKESS